MSGAAKRPYFLQSVTPGWKCAVKLQIGDIPLTIAAGFSLSMVVAASKEDWRIPSRAGHSG